MKISKKTQLGLRLVTIFLAIFFLAYFSIQITQSAFSTPSKELLVFNGKSITLGPAPNATNVRLDTTITIDTLESASLNNLLIIPEVNISHESSYTSGPLTYEKTFYSSQPLEPNTSYVASILVLNTPISWNFKTTSEVFNPGVEYFLVTNAILISLLIAALVMPIFNFFINRVIIRH